MYLEKDKYRMVGLIGLIQRGVRGFLHGLNDISIRKKFVLSYIAVVLFPVLLVGLILTNGMRQLALDQAVHEATNNVDRVKKRITEIMRISIAISNKFYIDRSLENILEHRYTSTWEVVSSYLDYRALEEYTNLYSEISVLRVYSDNPTLLENWRIMKVTPEILNASWYQNALANKGRIHWRIIYYPELKKTYFSLVRSITETQTVGVLAVGINPNFLDQILQQESFETLLIDKTGYILAASDRSLVGKTAAQIGLVTVFAGDNSIREMKYKGKVSKVICAQISPQETYGSIKIISVFPVNQIVARANRLSRLGLCLIALSLILSFMAILILAWALTERIRVLSSGAHKIASGDFEYSLAIEGRDEIGQLSTDLNSMIRSIQDLLAEIYEINLQKKQLELEQKDIKLNMLTNQINPHFLFNVLETIRMKAHSHGESELAQIVKLLGKILRRSLETGGEPAPLAAELDLVTGYLEIQKFRFGEKLAYRIEVDEELKGCLVLPLIIQPLVENAVVHGVEKKEGNGLVILTIKQDHDLLRIEVKDDGVGMDPRQLESVLTTLQICETQASEVKASETITPNHIGIQNVHQRLRLFYGDDYGLRIESRLNQGTVVELRVPYRH